MQDALEQALPIIAVTTTNQTQIGLQANTMRASLAHLYELLKEYRSHEALALMLEELQQQLKSCREIEQTLTRWVHFWYPRML